MVDVTHFVHCVLKVQHTLGCSSNVELSILKVETCNPSLEPIYLLCEGLCIFFFFFFLKSVIQRHSSTQSIKRQDVDVWD